jgi:hypothetical protein
MERDVKQESSIPAQARVSMVSLAELVNYWESEGFRVRTMSQLIAWSLDLLCDTIKRSNSMPVVIESVTEAHRHLEQRGLYQGSLKARAYKKVGAALRFETLRSEGIDPRDYTPIDYNILHNRRSVEPSPIDTELSNEDLVKIAQKKMEEIKLAKQMEMHEEYVRKQEGLKRARESGLIVDDPVPPAHKPGEGFREGISDGELDEYNAKREAERIALENAPIDIDYLMKNVVKPK